MIPASFEVHRMLLTTTKNWLMHSYTYNHRHDQSIILLKELQIKKEWKPSKVQSCTCNWSFLIKSD